MSRHHAADDEEIDSAATLDVSETGIADRARAIRDDWGASRFQSVRRVCDDVRPVIEFVEWTKTGAGALRERLVEDNAYRAAIGAMRQAVRDLSGTVQWIDGNEQKDRGGSFEKLFADADQLLGGLSDATAAVRHLALEAAGVDQTVRDQAQRFVDEIDDELAARGSGAPKTAWARRVVNDMTRFHEEARRLYAEQRGTAGRIGAKSLGHAYDRYAKRERRNATALRWIVGVLALGIAALALWFHHAVTEATLVLELARLSASVPLGLLAVYLARESTRHRTAALRARELAIALHTVDDYIKNSAPQDGHALRQALGMRAFGAGAEPPAANPSDPDLIQALLTRLTETVSVEVLDRLGFGKNGSKNGESGGTRSDRGAT